MKFIEEIGSLALHKERLWVDLLSTNHKKMCGPKPTE